VEPFQRLQESVENLSTALVAQASACAMFDAGKTKPHRLKPVPPNDILAAS
jgi:hypothetical protein